MRGLLKFRELVHVKAGHSVPMFWCHIYLLFCHVSWPLWMVPSLPVDQATNLSLILNFSFLLTALLLQSNPPGNQKFYLWILSQISLFPQIYYCYSPLTRPLLFFCGLLAKASLLIPPPLPSISPTILIPVAKLIFLKANLSHFLLNILWWAKTFRIKFYLA